MPTPLRYLLFQIPGWVVSAALLTVLWEIELLPGRLAAGLWGLWVVKDAITYPFVYRSYEARAQQHAAADLVGERAVVVRALEPRGWVRVRGELWRAEGDRAITAGEEVVIVAAESMRLVVRAAESSSSSGANHTPTAQDSSVHGR
jgi:membrane protein implicated in regulation of membrane protease activity